MIIGVIITAGAFATFYYSSVEVMEKYPFTEILFAGDTLEPLSSVSGLVEIDFDDDFFLGVRAIPQGQHLILSLVSEQGQEVITAPIGEVFFEKLSGVESGLYKFEISHFGSEPVSVYAILTAHDMGKDFETFGNFAVYVMVGSVLLLPGIILIFGSGTFIIYKKIKERNKVQK